MKFKITGLFDKFDYELDFKNEINILIGENGVGKSTILRILELLINKDFYALAKYKFKTIEIIDGNISISNELKVKKLEYDMLMPILISYHEHFPLYYKQLLKEERELFYKTVDSKERKKIFDNHTEKIYKIKEKLLITEEYKELVDEINLEKVQEEKNNEKRKILEKELEKPFESKEREIEYSPIYFIKNFLVKQNDLDSEESKIVYHNLVKDEEEKIIFKGKNYDGDNYVTLMENLQKVLLSNQNCEEISKEENKLLLTKKVKKVLTEIILNNFRYYLKMYTTLPKKDGNDINELFKDMFEPYNFDKTKAHILEKGLKDEILHIIQVIAESQGILSFEYEGIEYSCLEDTAYKYNIKAFFEYLEQNYNEIMSLRNEKLIQLEDILKDYLYNKYVEAYINDKFLEVRVYDKKTGNEIEIKNLSSGEKKIIRIIKILVSSEEKNYILLDEPELSLSIYWQEKLIPDLLKYSKSKKIIIATQSPKIVSDEYIEFLIPIFSGENYE